MSTTVTKKATATVDALRKIKARGEKFSCITAYDACFAHIVSEAGIETLLIGDSLGMVIQGHQTTIPVSVEDICYHTACTARANPRSLIIADMPFMSHPDTQTALKNAEKLMRAGAQMVKLEGGDWMADMVKQLVTQGIPVCAHIGLLPQNVNTESGYKIKGRTQEEVEQLLNDAKVLEAAGAQCLLMECVLASTAKRIDEAITIPTIGIGAGPATTGQVLVLHDMLGLYPNPPKFSKNFMLGADSIQQAITNYHHEVQQGLFPGPEHTFIE